MMDISTEISNAYQATQLIIVFVIFLFTIFYPTIRLKIDTDAMDGFHAKKRFMIEIRSTFWSKSFIIFLSNLLVILLLLPVINTLARNFDWNFNYEIYSFLVLFIFLLGLFIWSISLSYNVINKIKVVGKFTRSQTIKFILNGNVS